MSEPIQVVLHISRLISTNSLWTTPRHHKSRVRSAAYRAWIEEIGWELRQQLVGVPTLVGRFSARIEIPMGIKIDHDNGVKAVLDILQSVRAIRNDSGLHGLEVVPVERFDVLVVLTDLGGPEQREPRVFGAGRKPGKARKERVTPGLVARWRKAGMRV